jgi:predicted transcriptional regulator
MPRSKRRRVLYPISSRVEAEIHEGIQRIMREKDVTQAWIVRQALREYVRRHIDQPEFELHSNSS